MNDDRLYPASEDEDDVQIVLDAIEFMLTLASLTPALRRELKRVKAQVERWADAQIDGLKG